MLPSVHSCYTVFIPVIRMYFSSKKIKVKPLFLSVLFGPSFMLNHSIDMVKYSNSTAAYC